MKELKERVIDNIIRFEDQQELEACEIACWAIDKVKYIHKFMNSVYIKDLSAVTGLPEETVFSILGTFMEQPDLSDSQVCLDLNIQSYYPFNREE